MRNVDWIVIALTVAYVLVLAFTLWVGLGALSSRSRVHSSGTSAQIVSTGGVSCLFDRQTELFNSPPHYHRALVRRNCLLAGAENA
jgi:hypothetical protein